MQNFKDFDTSTGLTRKNIGLVYARQPQHIVFEKTPECKDISNMQADCGCSTPINEENKITIHYVPRDVPEGAKEAWRMQPESTRTPQPSHIVEKGVTITFSDQTTERILFRATVSML